MESVGQTAAPEGTQRSDADPLTSDERIALVQLWDLVSPAIGIVQRMADARTLGDLRAGVREMKTLGEVTENAIEQDFPKPMQDLIQSLFTQIGVDLD